MTEALEPIESPSLVGEEVGEWKIISPLGEGGMSVVYLGEHKFLKQSAAIKLLRPEFCRDAAVLGRFQQEALAASRLQHENIIEVSNFGRDPKHGYFMVLEYLEGVELDLVIEDAPLPKGWITPLMKQICSALHTTHQAQIIHRDLKPSNIFLLPQANGLPRVKLLDFGIAKVHFESTSQKLTSTGVIVGTPAYLAPEQVVPRRGLTHSADIYAVGVVLFQMLTGHLPLFAESTIEHVIKVLQVDAPLAGTLRPELTGSDIEAFLARILEKKPENRPATMKQVWEEYRTAIQTWDDPLEHPDKYPDLAVFMTEEAFARRQQEQVHVATSAFETQGQVQLGVQGGILPTGNAVVGSGPAVGVSEPSDDVFQTAVDTRVETPKAGGGQHLTYFLLSGIVAMAAVLGYYMWPKSTAKPAVRRAAAPVQPKRNAFEGLAFGGIALLKKQKYKKAITLMRQAIRSKQFKKSRFFPRLYTTVGKAYKEKRQLYNAMQYIDRYLNALRAIRKHGNALGVQIKRAKDEGRAKDAAALQRELNELRERIPKRAELDNQLKAFASWRRALKQRTDMSQGMMSRLGKQLQRGRYAEAHQSFQKIRKLAPAHPEVLRSLAKTIGKQFPHVADGLLTLVFRETDVPEKLKQQLSGQQAALRLQLKKGRLSVTGVLKEVDAAIAAKKWRKALRLLNRQVKLSLFAQQHGQIKQWLDALRASQPAAAVKLWGWYAKRWRSLERKKLSVWVNQGSKSPVVVKELRSQQQALRYLVRVKGLWQDVQQALERGNIGRASRKNKQLLGIWERLKAKDKWDFQSQVTTVHSQATALQARLSSSTKGMQRARRFLQLAQFARAQEAQRDALRALKGTAAFVRWQKVFQRNDRLMKRAINHRKSAQYRTQQLRWRDAEKHFKAYLKLFPQAHDKKEVKRKIKLCRCGYIQGSWEVCPTRDSKALLRRMRRRR